MWRAGLAALAVAALLGGRPAARADEIRIETKDGTRSAIVVPSGAAPAPAVVVLHGATIGAQRTLRGSGFAEAAAAHGFAAAFPDGIYRQWNDGREEGRVSGVDDVGFLRRLVGELIARGVADPARIYLAGISNGGMMTFRMLCEASELFAGAGTIIANMPAGIGEACQPKKALPLVMFNGTADPLVPYRGGGVGFAGRRGNVWAAERSAAFMARGNGCGATPATRRSPPAHPPTRPRWCGWIGPGAAPGSRSPSIASRAAGISCSAARAFLPPFSVPALSKYRHPR